jgi:hypothetical protein
MAKDAKEGAMVIGDDFFVQIEGLERWPGAILDKRVRVTGILVEKRFPEQPGEIPIQQPRGGLLIMQHATWEAIP